MRSFIISLLCFISFSLVKAQSICTAPGQNPGTAFPVCGTATFIQNTVPLCGGRPVAYKACSNLVLTDINPYWYKFTCFKSGSLGFLITPNDLADDYDWELYDITGVDPNTVYTNSNLVVSNNWSGESGLTGASNAGSQLFVCGGFGKPLFSKMPTLIQDHNYLMLVSHFTRTQSGYSLNFSGGTAVITDPNAPKLKAIEASCGGNELRLSISKKIKCSSIAADGSDFYITSGTTSITGATGINCSSTFDADSIKITLPQFLAPGNYSLHIKRGSDGNTLVDFCDVPVSESDVIPFTILPRAATPMDSVAPLNCAPKKVRLVFKTPMSCSSIADNGSDFLIKGTYPVNIISANGVCTNGNTKEIEVTFDKPLFSNGNFSIILKKGTDGNTLINECGEETPAGSSISFSTKDTVSADFSYKINYGCVKDSVAFFNEGLGGVTNWKWTLDEGLQSSIQNPVAVYSIFDKKSVQLIVSNGFCSDTVIKAVPLLNRLQASFSVVEDNCPNEPILFTSTAIGTILNHKWTFGDGGLAAVASPTHVYAVPLQQRPFVVSYTITDSFGCVATAQKIVTIYAGCNLAVPNAFTPNGDGLNDTFFPANAVKADDLDFKIFNRWGQLIYKTKDWKMGWDGTLNGNRQQAGVYVWMLRYTDRDTKKQVNQKGSITLIR